MNFSKIRDNILSWTMTLTVDNQHSVWLLIILSCKLLVYRPFSLFCRELSLKLIDSIAQCLKCKLCKNFSKYKCYKSKINVMLRNMIYYRISDNKYNKLYNFSCDILLTQFPSIFKILSYPFLTELPYFLLSNSKFIWSLFINNSAMTWLMILVLTTS